MSTVEIIEQWADWVSPDWHAQFGGAGFSEAERQAIADYQAKLDEALRQCLPGPMPPCFEMHKGSAVGRVEKSSERSLLCFVRGQNVRKRRVPSTSSKQQMHANSVQQWVF